MINGTVPKWQRYGHRSPVGMVILFGILIWWPVRLAFVLLIAICAELLASVATSNLLERLSARNLPD